MESYAKILACLSAGAVVALIACTGGGPSVPPGTQCDPGYTPINFIPNTSQQALSQAPGQNPPSIMPAGAYQYDHTDIYYVGNDPVNPLQIQFRDAAIGSPGPTTHSIVCVRNFNPAINNVNISANVISDILVNYDLSQSITYRNIVFQIQGGVYNFPPPTVFFNAATTIDAVYNGKDQQILLMRNQGYAFELRTQGSTDNGNWWAATYMNYNQCPPAAQGGCPAPM